MSDLKNELQQFTGTETYYHLPHGQNYNFTDGIQYLARKAGAYWLIEQIFAAQSTEKIKAYRAKGEWFQVWKLEKEEIAGDIADSAFLICEDGNNNEIYREHIPFTDFPLNRIDLWLEHNVLILPSEY